MVLQLKLLLLYSIETCLSEILSSESTFKGKAAIIYFICGCIHQQKLVANFLIKQVNSFSQCVTAT